MKEALIQLLGTFNYPVRLQGSLSPKEAYPNSFFSYWNNEVSDGHHYDNDAIFYEWNFTVSFYSIDPSLVNTVLVQLRTLLKQNGWIVRGKGYDVASDEITHTGRAIDILYMEHPTTNNNN